MQGFDPEQIEDIRSLITSRGWRESLLPYFGRAIMALESQLLDPSNERRGTYPDDYLRGSIQTLKGLSTFGHDVVAQADHAAMIRDQEKAEADDIQERKDLGHIGPLPVA